MRRKGGATGGGGVTHPHGDWPVRMPARAGVQVGVLGTAAPHRGREGQRVSGGGREAVLLLGGAGSQSGTTAGRRTRRLHGNRRRCLRHRGSGYTRGKGGVFAMKAAEAHEGKAVSRGNHLE